MAQPSSDTRTALLDAALECFAYSGFDGTSIRMIAEKAGRPLSLISHHFGGKEGLYMEVFRRMLMDYYDRFMVEPALQREPPATCAEAIQTLRDLVRFLYLDLTIKQRSQNPAQECGSLLWLREFRAPRPVLQPLLRTCLSPLVERLRACVTLICPGLDPAKLHFLCTSLLGMINGHAMMSGLNEVIWGREEAFGDPEEEAERLMDICLRGLEGFTSCTRTPQA